MQRSLWMRLCHRVASAAMVAGAAENENNRQYDAETRSIQRKQKYD